MTSEQKFKLKMLVIIVAFLVLAASLIQYIVLGETSFVVLATSLFLLGLSVVSLRKTR